MSIRGDKIRDVIVSKDDRVIYGLGVQITDDLWIKNENVFVKIPYDYNVAYLKKDDFLECIEGYELTSTPCVGDIIRWFSGDSFFFIDRFVEEILYDETLGEIAVVSVFGVRQPIVLRTSAVFVRRLKT